ncbi:MAG: polyprenyl synthetase family protein [Phycisphaerae bacterium]
MPTDLHELRSLIAPQLEQVVRRFDAELDSRYSFVRDLCGRVVELRGKMLRPTLTLLAGRACGDLTDQHVVVATVVEMIHVATLVHDDVLDEADLRRRAPTINRHAGNETAVLLGDYLISHAYHLCSSLDSVRAARRVAAATNRVCEGELMQVHHRGDWGLSEEGYLEIVRLKTAELTRAACELGAVLAGAAEPNIAALAAYGEDVGIAFQIVDDMLDITAAATDTGKSVGRDALLAKPTLPVIHFLAHADRAGRDQLTRLAAESTPQARGELRRILIDLGSLDYARATATRHAESAVSRLSVLPESEARHALAHAATMIIDRGA